MWIRWFVRTYVCMYHHACVYDRTYVCIRYVCGCAGSCTCIYNPPAQAHTYIHTYIQVYFGPGSWQIFWRTDRHICIHAYTHIHIHTYIHTYIQVYFGPGSWQSFWRTDRHICIHAYSHIHIHTYIHTGVFRARIMADLLENRSIVSHVSEVKMYYMTHSTTCHMYHRCI